MATQVTANSQEPGQKLIIDPVHHLTLRPAGAVNVMVNRR